SKWTVGNLLQPAIELLFSCSFTYHVDELLHQLIGQVNLWVHGAQPCKRELFFCRELFGSAQKHPGGLTRRNGGLFLERSVTVPLPEAVDQVAHTLIRSPGIFGGEFAREACHVVATLFPPLTDEREVWIKLSGLFTLFALGKSSSLYPSLDRTVADSHPFSNSLMAQPLFPQGHGLLVTSEPLCPMQLYRVLLQWGEVGGALALQRGNSFPRHLRLLPARNE